MFLTCPLPPLVHNEMSGVVTLMRHVKHADCRRQLGCWERGPAGKTVDLASGLSFQIPISNIPPLASLPPEWWLC